MTLWVRCFGVLLAIQGAQARASASPPAVRPPVHGAAPSPAAQARAEFRRGVRLFRAGDKPGAAAAFARAYELSGDHRLLYNLAQVEADREHYAEALRLLCRYLKLGGAQIGAQRRAEVERERERLERQVTAVRVATNAARSTLWIDGAERGSLPSEPVWLDPGQHRVHVEASGHVPARRTLELRPGERLLLAMPLRPSARTLARPAAETPADVNETSPASFADRTPFWLSLGAAGASGGLALAFIALTRAADARLDRELQRFPVDEAALGSARSRLRALSAASDAALGVTAIATGLSVYFALRPPPVPTDRPPASTRQLRLVPLGAGAALRGAF